jgi:crotonobetainyl-CoA:carnitine CoA-transferase CaiB-like acyl-CoA transferase
MGTLDGIRVIDLSLFLPGPMLTMMMADQGAAVIKVEPPAGDPARDQPPFEGGQSVWFRGLNRGKDCVRIDLKTPAGRDELWALIAGADVFVEGFRPGVMARLGFDYAAVSARHPQIIYCSISAFGQTGPLSQHPAHDLAVQAMTGFLAVNDGDDGHPVVPGVASADLAAGLTGLSAILMALIGRGRTGRGDHIDCAMADSLLPWCTHSAGDAIAGGAAPVSATQRSLGGAAFYQVYRCADGRHIVLGGREVKFATALLTALERPDLIAEAQRPAGEQQRLIAFLRDIFAQKPRDEWTAWFAGRDIAFAPVLDFRDMLASDHAAARGLLRQSDGGHAIAPAIRFASQTGG